ncbi:hypothetical protein [uncultured Pontibacter sp.]|uniref:hypothetical protein n=1 Tax=uncultured Pontibacter sp. TaxID=453356 RepID=UPI002608421E|nr:hypothetical protein [uncultured Pontibacter sp.]
MIKNIWKDPVWSKVISVGIIGLISLAYARFISVTEHLTFQQALNKIIEIRISVIYIICGIISYWVLAWVIRNLLKKDNELYNKKQRELRKFNKHHEPKSGLLARWQVLFDYDTPFISDLSVFCTKHDGPPVRFMDNKCPFLDCPNSMQIINKEAIKNLIESDLIHKWDNLK